MGTVAIHILRFLASAAAHYALSESGQRHILAVSHFAIRHAVRHINRSLHY